MFGFGKFKPEQVVISRWQAPKYLNGPVVWHTCTWETTRDNNKCGKCGRGGKQWHRVWRDEDEPDNAVSVQYQSFCSMECEQSYSWSWDLCATCGCPGWWHDKRGGGGACSECKCAQFERDPKGARWDYQCEYWHPTLSSDMGRLEARSRLSQQGRLVRQKRVK